MLKRIGLFSLLLFGVSAAVVPVAAQAQDRYYGYGNNYGSGKYYYDGHRGGDAYGDGRWNDGYGRSYGREDREWREREHREHRRWERERREHERWDREYGSGYYPNSYLYFQYGR